jgi:hypothetical protein
MAKSTVRMWLTHVSVSLYKAALDGMSSVTLWPVQTIPAVAPAPRLADILRLEGCGCVLAGLGLPTTGGPVFRTGGLPEAIQVVIP